MKSGGVLCAGTNKRVAMTVVGAAQAWAAGSLDCRCRIGAGVLKEPSWEVTTLHRRTLVVVGGIGEVAAMPLRQLGSTVLREWFLGSRGGYVPQLLLCPCKQQHWNQGLHQVGSSKGCRSFRTRSISASLSSAVARTGTRKRSRKSQESQSAGLSNIGDAVHIQWWEMRMKACTKPSTLEMIKRLTYSNLLGVDEGLKNGTLKDGSLNSDLLEVKRKFPHEVLMCRVGEFYECVGFDACMLIEYASLNPMGGLRGNSTPKAGCPIVNLRHTLDCLTRQGFSVCIMEEVQGPSQARMRKERFVGGHAHPGSPYVYGLAGADVDLEFVDPEPVIGISKSTRGYCFISVLEIMKTYSVEDGLTEEAVVAKLRSKRSQRLYLHRSLKDDGSATVRWGEYGEGGLLWAECNGKQFEWYSNDSVKELLSKVKELYDLVQGEDFRKIVPPAGERPRPLYVGTASQIGILSTPGVPSLPKVLLPEDTNGLCVAYIRDLLLNPPPFVVAQRIQAACKKMASVQSAIPDFTCVSSAKLVKLIGAQEANKMEFSRIQYMAEDILDMHNSAELGPILEQLLDPVWLATGLRIDRDQLVEDCRYLVHAIGKVLAVEGDPEQAHSRGAFVPEDFFYDMEQKWRGKVRRGLAEEVYREVDEAAAALSDAVVEDFLPIVQRTRSMTNGGGSLGCRAEICYNRDSQSVWFKGKHFKPLIAADTRGEAEISRLIPASDNKGKKAGEEWHTTLKVQEALERYKNAADRGASTVIGLLRELAENLKAKMNAVVFVSAFSIIAKALFSHVREAKRQSWVFPDLVRREQRHQMVQQNFQAQQAAFFREAASLQLIDLVPYWLDKTLNSAVPNTVEMNSMFLLTGPNGGGKSSLLRSICAATLLANCGLMVPAKAAVVPHYDAIMLRMISHDSPADAKSAFQIEMSELRSIIVEATGQSLVMADEMCKGTEVQKGTFIAASVIEHLDQIGCMGVLSTHLHGLLDLQLDVKHVVRKAMGTTVVQGQVRPTWKLVDGVCRESLAFEMARKEGVPDKVIARAEALFKEQQQKQFGAEIAKPEHKHVESLLRSAAAHDPVETQNLVETRITAGDGFGEDLVNGSSHSLAETETQVGLLPVGSDEQYGTGCFEGEGEAIFSAGASSGFHQKVQRFFTIDDVQGTFEATCLSKLEEISPQASHPQCRLVRARQRPPPDTTRHSCVYMLLRPDGKFYVGQTDNISGRIATHRKGEALKHAPFIYLTVENKSVASELETVLIHRLPQLGLTLVNKADQYHRHFGTALSSATIDAPPF